MLIPCEVRISQHRTGTVQHFANAGPDKTAPQASPPQLGPRGHRKPNRVGACSGNDRFFKRVRRVLKQLCDGSCAKNDIVPMRMSDLLDALPGEDGDGNAPREFKSEQQQ